MKSEIKQLSVSSKINFYSEGISFVLRNKKKIALWLLKCASAEQLIVGEINFIFCNDAYLLKINKKYLQHDDYTDIITFPLQTGPIMNADIYISIERVKENAKLFGVSYYEELNRVMSHGILHLCGYGDKSVKEIKKMREMESKWLLKRKRFFS